MAHLYIWHKREFIYEKKYMHLYTYGDVYNKIFYGVTKHKTAQYRTAHWVTKTNQLSSTL
jgi:hypothetical protein